MKILVIEDQPELREVVVLSLQESGFAVDQSGDGEEGLYKALNWDYDCIVLDILLPGLDGWQVLEKLRLKKTTPVLMLTALNATKDRIRGLNQGADDYLPKPFDLHELEARIGALIRRSSGAPSPLIHLDEIVINTAAQEITIGNKLVDLTAREYAMVELLARHQGQVLSRDFLYEHLFDENDESLSNMLDVYVYKIRQKLGKDFVKTRRGQGYLVSDH